jgi:hypothetical protein
MRVRGEVSREENVSERKHYPNTSITTRSCKSGATDETGKKSGFAIRVNLWLNSASFPCSK